MLRINLWLWMFRWNKQKLKLTNRVCISSRQYNIHFFVFCFTEKVPSKQFGGVICSRWGQSYTIYLQQEKLDQWTIKQNVIDEAEVVWSSGFSPSSLWLSRAQWQNQFNLAHLNDVELSPSGSRDGLDILSSFLTERALGASMVIKWSQRSGTSFKLGC